ncbi:MAG: ComF family protein [Rickettsiaceae bacterium]|nr:ComF family protein [Rickettsiaceae bacterium]
MNSLWGHNGFLPNLISMIKYFASSGLDFLAPYKCISCNAISMENNALCSICWSKHIFIEEPLCKRCGIAFEIDIGDEALLCPRCANDSTGYDVARSIFKYNEGSKSIIFKFKYGDQTHLANFFAKMFMVKYRDLIMSADIITCVPMHKLKRIFRLYNQSQVIAKSLSNNAKIQFLPNLIIKKSYTKSQSSLSREKRKTNLKDNFLVTAKLANKVILILDDVESTGSTLKECSLALKKAGAETVVALSIAKNYW